MLQNYIISLNLLLETFYELECARRTNVNSTVKEFIYLLFVLLCFVVYLNVHTLTGTVAQNLVRGCLANTSINLHCLSKPCIKKEFKEKTKKKSEAIKNQVGVGREDARWL